MTTTIRVSSASKITVSPDVQGTRTIRVKQVGPQGPAGSLDTHNHDDRYYTEAETTTLLAGKSDTGHTHDDRYFTESEVVNALSLKSNLGHTHPVAEITDFDPSTHIPGYVTFENLDANGDVGTGASQVARGNHLHDDRYYLESEVDTLLLGKSDTGHTHDDRYFTEGEVTTLLAGKSDTGHTHDDRYFTESEADARFAPISHSHDDLYFTEAEVTSLLAGKSDTGHSHDDLYFTEAEVTTLLAGKSDSGHSHNDLYFTEAEVTSLLSGKSDTGHTHEGTTIESTGAPIAYVLTADGSGGASWASPVAQDAIGEGDAIGLIIALG